MLFLDPLVYAAIWVESVHNKVDFYLVAALIQQESSFRPHAIGDGGDSYGLMQLNVHGAGASSTPEELLDISHNIRYGVAYLALCLEAFPNTPHEGIAAYRQGIQGVKDNGWKVSEVYVNQIFQRAMRYRRVQVQRFPPEHRYAFEE
ncbi:hypothetical protein LCGC14_1460920 [marine sediment metagenome]|uniref:Transglycosylase SLT domain-containing protein n=1 Tax=marine sediment metagenome TaxID=412755 RepID=A0A0F9JFQ4_9ZZZZ